MCRIYMVDIRMPWILREVKGLATKCYKHPYIQTWNSADKKTQFFKKVTLKAIILGIQMYSTWLLLWKNQEGSTCYPMILYKQDSTAVVFLWIFKFFSDKLFHKTAPNHWL